MAERLTVAEVSRLLRRVKGDEFDRLVDSLADDPREQVRQTVARAKRRMARERAEEARVRTMYAKTVELAGEGFVLGVDEVGRGAVAGPLTVAAVALPAEPIIRGLNDSKQLTPHWREAIARQIHAVALAIGIYHVPPTRIDGQGMARSLREAMAGAIRLASESAGREPDAVLIDGRPVGVHPKEICIVKGDATIAPIAAASVVAKVTRDAALIRAADVWPGYTLSGCKGYASKAHIAAIRRRGLTPYHRRSFCGNFLAGDDQPSLF